MLNSQVTLMKRVILSSSIKAFEKYYEMSEGAWLYNTPEYWYTTQVAMKLRKRIPKFCFFIENSIAEVRAYATKGAGRPSKRLSTGRTDISVWKYCKGKDEYTPKCIIEVKRAWGWNSQTMIPDIDRLCGVIRETNKSISTVFFLILSDEEDRVRFTAEEALHKRKDTIHDKVKAYVGDKKLAIRVDSEIKLSNYYNDDASMFAAMLFTFTLDNRKN